MSALPELFSNLHPAAFRPVVQAEAMRLGRPACKISRGIWTLLYVSVLFLQVKDAAQAAACRVAEQCRPAALPPCGAGFPVQDMDCVATGA